MKINALLVDEKGGAKQIEISSSLEVFEGILGGEISIINLNASYLLISRNDSNMRNVIKNVLGVKITGTCLVVGFNSKVNEMKMLSDVEIEYLQNVFSKGNILQEDFDGLIECEDLAM